MLGERCIAYIEIDAEIQRTYSRVDRLEFPPMSQNSLKDRLCLLVEELGEIAELIKIINGKKPKHIMSHGPVEVVQVAIRNELIQLGAITVDWLTCDARP